MRISTNTLYERGIAGILDRQGAQLKLQQQIASGRRVLTPSDDPIAAASALEIGQAKALNDQYQVNIGNARAVLMLGEQALGDITRLLQDVKVIAVNAGNASLRNEDRASLANELEGRYRELLGIANRTDGGGQYLFSGYRGGTQPFSETLPGVVNYNGDEGQRLIRIGASRQLAVNDSGSAVFQAIAEGNGSFVATAASGNAGGGIISSATVVDASAWNGAGNPGNFSVLFHVDVTATPPATTYDIVDTVNNISLLTGLAPAAGPHLRTYAGGSAISLKTAAPPDTSATPFDYGAQLVITGALATGDAFALRPAASRDMFASLNDLISTLRTGNSGSMTSAAEYQNRLNAAMSNLDNALENVLTVRASAGVRLRELDTAYDTASDISFMHSENLSRLQDLDYASALSDLSREQIYLEAAQKSFIQITTLRLFDFI
ncbi:MAG: flagellar hook-associated protein FlgL [Burkholderiales bacterium]|nr:flagellar hook-associated protein FlgL [Burkholderiales bacterium]